jgi:hypothetical protein
MLDDMVDRGLIDPPPPKPEKFVESSYWEKAVRTLD